MNTLAPRLKAILLSLMIICFAVSCGSPASPKSKNKQMSPQVKETLDSNKRMWAESDKTLKSDGLAKKRETNTNNVQVETMAGGGKRYTIESGTRLEDMPPELQDILNSPPEVDLGQRR